MNDFLRAKLVMGNFFVDRSDELSAGGDTVNTPNITEMSANSKSNATAVTLNSPTETDVNLVVNNWFEVSFLIEDKEAAQVKRSYRIQETYARNAAHTAAKKLEVAIADLFDDFSNSVGTSGADLTDVVIREAIETYTSNDGDFDEAAWFLHPKTVWTDVMGIDKFALIQNTNGADPVMKGAVGMLYGRPVFPTTNIQKINSDADYSGALVNPDAIHWATSPLPGARANGVRLQANYMPEYLGTLVTADILYGVIENRDVSGVSIVSGV